MLGNLWGMVRQSISLLYSSAMNIRIKAGLLQLFDIRHVALVYNGFCK